MEQYYFVIDIKRLNDFYSFCDWFVFNFKIKDFDYLFIYRNEE